MNARNAAIEQAKIYWQGQGLPADTFTIVARQAPLPGSIWWVEAHLSDARYDLLVDRVDKHTYHFEAQCPYGYTIYAIHKGRETPLAVVEYAALANDRIKTLAQDLRYAHASLRFLPNPSDQWSQSMQQLLENKEQVRASKSRQKADLTDAIDRLIEARVIAQQLTTPTQTRAVSEPYPQEVFDLLEQAIKAKGHRHSIPHLDQIHHFLATHTHDHVCHPFGWVWSRFECLYLTPDDALSQWRLFGSRRWQREKYRFYFDGEHLHECVSDDDLRDALGFDY